MTDEKGKRSGCLAAFIIVLIIVYAMGALGSFLTGPIISGLMPEYATSTSYSILSGVLSLINIIFLIGVWKYKKWGFFGFVGVSIINIIISIFLTNAILIPIISGLIFPLILYLLIRPIWNHMS
ncbi:MAG: hypothetical protein K0S75_987 [Clostridia bacterium]|jgi:hypothetical protein|nr:hypothetical protein [Clostridia bacterium]